MSGPSAYCPCPDCEAKLAAMSEENKTWIISDDTLDAVLYMCRQILDDGGDLEDAIAFLI